MLSRKSFTVSTVALALSLSTSGLALAQTSFSLEPNPANRLHAEKVDAIAALLSADYDWAKDGTLSIAIAAGAPPIATYATMAPPWWALTPISAGWSAGVWGCR